jgi:hypothetical protein
MSLLDELVSNSTVIAAIISAIVSFFVALFFGERASTRFAMKEETRARHHSTLVAQPINQLITGILNNYESSMRITAASPTQIQVGTVDDIVGRADKHEDELDLLLSHIKTGYPSIFWNLRTFKELYDNTRLRTLDIGNRALATFDGIANAPQSFLPASGMTEFSNFAFAIQLFSLESLKAWKEKREMVDIGRYVITATKGFQVNFEGGVVLQTSRNDVLAAVVTRMNQLKDSRFHSEFLEVYRSLSELERLLDELGRELSKTRVYVNSGVPLKGYCEAGRQARPKIE